MGYGRAGGGQGTVTSGRRQAELREGRHMHGVSGSHILLITFKGSDF